MTVTADVMAADIRHSFVSLGCYSMISKTIAVVSI
jgi:hypothetical protein